MKQEPYSNSSRTHTPQGKTLFRQSRWGRWPLILLGIVALLVVVLIASFLMRFHQLQQHLELGEKYLNELNYSSAVMEFTSAIEVDSRNEDAYLGRGEAYLGLGDFGSAIDDYTMVIYLNSSTIDGYVGRSRARAAQGEQAKAEEDLQMAIASGLDEAQAETIWHEIAAPPSALTAADVTWLIEPSYNYDDVEPIYSYLFDHYTGEPLQDDRYSIYDNYYAITRGDSYSLYEMETQSEYPDWQTGLVNEFGYPTILKYEGKESRINVYPVGSEPAVSTPWEGVGYALPHGTICGAIIYDSDKQSFLYVCVSEMDESISTEQDFIQGSWAKPYPVIQCTSKIVNYGNPSYPTYPVFGYENYYGTDSSPLFAYVSPRGSLLSSYQFDNATGFSDGLAACSENGKWGYIDESGNKVTDFIYDPLLPIGVSTTVEGSDRHYSIIRYGYPCTCDTMVVGKDGYVGLLYRDGSVLIEFGEFEDLAPAYNDQLWAKQNGLWGLVDLADVKRQTNHS